MKNKLFRSLTFALIIAALIFTLVSCPAPEDVVDQVEDEVGITVTLIFKHIYTGEPIEDVKVVINGEEKTSDSSGKVSVSSKNTTISGKSSVKADNSSMQIEGYISKSDLNDLGYKLVISTWDDIPLYFNFTVTSSYEATRFLYPLVDTTPTAISGTVKNKNGDPLTSGYIDIYTSDGRYVISDSISVSGGSYTGIVYTTGKLYFIVTDTAGDNYYTVVDVTGSTYDIAYDGTDINFKGDAADATYVYAYLQLGQVLAFIDGFSLSSPFDILVPHQGSDVIRLESGKSDGYGNWTYYYSPTQYTEGASGLNFSFATGSTVEPSTWDHDLAWDGTSRTLTWKAAGNASYYFIKFRNPVEICYLLAAVEGTSLTVPAAIDLTGLLNIGIYPYWSEEGFIRYVMPCAMASGTIIPYDGLAVLKPVGDG